MADHEPALGLGEKDGKPLKVVVSGAGPAGLLATHLLLNRSKHYSVTLLERGENFADAQLEVKRSWMIGLGPHGLSAIKRVPGLYERVRELGIRGKGVFLHLGKKAISLTPEKSFSDEEHEGYFVDRNWIVSAQMKYLMEQHGHSGRLEVLFETKVLAVEGDSRTVISKDAKGHEHRHQYDLLLGCDGVRSAVRNNFIRTHDFSCRVSDVYSRIKHIHTRIPSQLGKQHFHIFINCLGGGFGGVGLPELDATKGTTRFNLLLGTQVCSLQDCDPVVFTKDAKAIEEYLRKGLGHLDFDFADIAQQFVSQDWFRSGEARCNYYHLAKERTLLMGDAAHATAPSIGQGMNTALVDARVLDELMELHSGNLDEVLPAFSRIRVKEGQSLTDLSGYQFSFSASQQVRLSLASVFNGVLTKITGKISDPVSLAGLGFKLSTVYSLNYERTQAVRSVNESIRREIFETEVGLLPPRRASRSPWVSISLTLGCVSVFLASPWGVAVAVLLLLVGISSGRKAVRPVALRDVALAEKGMKLPGFVKALGKLPFSVTKHIILQPPASNLPNLRDVFGTSPYEFTTVVPDKVWSVKYTYQPDAQLSQLLVGRLSEANLCKKVLSDAADPEEEALLRADFDQAACCCKIPKKKGEAGEYLKAGLEMISFMKVLSTSNGGLLLYSPVKIDDEAKAWLDKLGRVDFIVSPSASHTSFVKSATEAYPSARVIASLPASIKVGKVGVKTDLNYTEALDEVVAALPDFDVKPMKADPSHELCLLHRATGTLCICDLLYCSTCEGPLPKDKAKDPKAWMGRIFTRLNFSPHFAGGLLPLYRHDMLDPESGFPIAPPLQPGARSIFGHSVMELLQTPGVQRVCGAHIPDTLSAPAARDLLQRSWGWACEEAIALRLDDIPV
mmetsp:Transcript_33105/g.72109  ORF Transcript_33105/g.72109 Transcript_33105/m.72109 type:complete len:902 (-) Transcript_33105:130-2835(-)